MPRLLYGLRQRELGKLLVVLPPERAAAAAIAFTGLRLFHPVSRITFGNGLPELKLTGKGAATRIEISRIPLVVASPLLHAPAELSLRFLSLFSTIFLSHSPSPASSVASSTVR
jgi:hypothetical protein